MSRLSHRGAVAAVSGTACLLVALLAAVGGESSLAVTLAALAGFLAVGLAGRDVAGEPPSATAHLSVAALAGLAALVSLSDQRWFTAVGLGGVAAMNFARGVDWRVDAEDESGDAEA